MDIVSGGIPVHAIDVGMIVFNEAEVIRRSLTALRAAGFDHYVILDMMSDDQTLAIVDEVLGPMATVTSMPRKALIEHGFAEARNVCAAFCKRDWVLFVDADEVLARGVDQGVVGVVERGSNPTLFAIERNNLGRDDEAGPGALKTLSVDRQNRLYKPSFIQRWRGYIHEEIHVGPRSGYDQNGKTALVFDHLSMLKSQPSGNVKQGLYATMLLRAHGQTALREGTNGWWYDVHVKENYPALQAAAAAFVPTVGLDPSFYAPEPSAPAAASAAHAAPVPAPAPALPSRSFTRPQEDSYGCTALRTLQSAPAAEWTGTPARALWAVWDHPAEQDRTIESLMATARAYRWNRFIRPGSVAIDIGGHAGDTALPMALLAYDRIAGTRGTVIVLEPNPAVLPVLRANLAMNTHLASFHLIEAAAADHDADSIELADHNNAGCNGGVLNGGFSAPVSAILNAAATIRYTAPAVSMAALLRHVRTSITAQPVGFIKFACQGFDKQILKPCRELFQVDQPVLFVNWFGWFTAEDDADLFATIEAIGYVPFDPVTLAPASVTQRIGNLLCVHRGRLSLLDASH